MLKNYERQFGSLPAKKSAPMADDDHPELDTSDILNEEKKHLYMSMVGAMQWAVTQGRIDIAYSTMVMSCFRIEPRIGHFGAITGSLWVSTKAPRREDLVPNSLPRP
jgi:hypothetical protein